MFDDPTIRSLERRRFLRHCAAAGAAIWVPASATAAEIGAMTGEVYVNGKRATRRTVIKPGEKVMTGPDSSMSFMIGRDAYMVRQLTLIMLEMNDDPAIVTGLRIVSGALAAAFGPGMKMIHTGLVAAAIRGTGIYVEANPVLTYFCTCYSEVGLTSLSDNSAKSVAARSHDANYVYTKPTAGPGIVAAPFINHSNAELAMLERMAGRPPVLPVK